MCKVAQTVSDEPVNLGLRANLHIEVDTTMQPLRSRPQATLAVLNDPQDRTAIVTCPMCHTPTPLTQSDIDAGAGWRCVRCGQQWSRTRLSTVAAYAASRIERPTID